MASKKIRDYLVIVTVGIVFSLFSTLPFTALSFISGCAITGLLGYAVTRYHYAQCAVVCLFVLIVHFLFSGSFFSAVFTAFPIVICGVILGVCYNTRISVYKTLMLLAAVYVLNLAFSMKLMDIAVGQQFIEVLITSIGQTAREAYTTLYGAELAQGEIDAIVAEFTSTLLQMTPSYMIIFSGVFSLISIYLFKKICRLQKKSCIFPAFSLWRGEKWLTISFLFLMAIYFIVPGSGIWKDTIINMITVLFFVFLVLGLSRTELQLSQRVKKPAVRKFMLLILLLASLFLMGIPAMYLATLGAIDSFANKNNSNLQAE